MILTISMSGQPASESIPACKTNHQVSRMRRKKAAGQLTWLASLAMIVTWMDLQIAWPDELARQHQQQQQQLQARRLDGNNNQLSEQALNKPTGRLSEPLWPQLRGAEAIRLLHLEAPASVAAGQPIRLRCAVETKGDRLLSLSWYKNGREFFRYQPSERNNQVLLFNQTGVVVDLSKSRNSTVTLTNTTVQTSGRYKCQATGTTFQEVNMDAMVKVTPAANSSSADRARHSQIWFACLILAHNFMVLVMIPKLVGR